MQGNKQRLSRRNFLKMTGGAAMIGLLAACVPASQGGGGEGASADNSLEFWMWNTFAPAADELMQEKLNEWGAANNVTLEISRDSDGNQQTKILPAIEGGTLPDAMFVGAGPALQLMDAQALDSLSDLFTEIGSAHGGWQPRLEEYVTRDGDIQFLPYSIDTPMTQFRTDVFEEAGITVPEGQWTWDETRDLCVQAQAYSADAGTNMVGWGFGIVKQQHDAWCQDLFRNFGADVWDETGTKIILADEKMDEAVRALNFAKEAFDLGLFPSDAASWDWASNNKAYQEDQAVLVINAASIFVWATENRPELAEVTGLAPKPKDVRDTTNAGLRYTLVMSKESDNKETAMDLIRGLYESEIYGPWLEKGFVANVLAEYNDLPMWTGTRAAFNLAAQIGTYGGYPAPFDNAAMAELNGPNEPTGSMMVRVLLDGWSPEDAIAETDEFAKRVFEKYF
ncbi:substrate-binding domain-containing protein [Chloroflexi bacterium TSY]|nr:substrate-binding domain-containing protein [Chloroflexi bacterium TSY]